MNKKIICLIVMILCISLLVSAKQSDETIFKDKKAFVNSSKAYFEQYPDTLKKGDSAKITFKTRIENELYHICFDFPVNNVKVKIKSIEKKGFLGLFNQDLNKVKRKNNQICIEQFSNTDEVELNYEMEYIGFDTIKYNVTVYSGKEIVLVLDPYLVGTLATSDNLIHHFALNGSNTDIKDGATATYHKIDSKTVGIWDFRIRQNSSNMANDKFNGSDTSVVYSTNGIQLGATTPSRVAVPDLNGQLDNLPAISYYAWIKFHSDNCSVADGRNNNAVIIGGFSGKTSILQIQGCDDVRFGLKSTLGDTNWSTSSGANLNDNSWHFIVGSWGVGEYDNKMRLYIDGVNVANNSLGGLTDNEDNFYIGSNTAGEKTYVYNGTIRDAGYYNRTLSREEVVALYNNGNYSLGVENNTNGSFHFGGNDVILFKNTSLFPKNNENRSVSFFVKGTKPSENFAGLFCYGSTTETFCLTSNTDGELVVRFSGASSTDTNVVVLDNTWHHTGIVWNGTTAFVYLDGSLSTTFGTALSTGNNYTATIGSIAYNRSQNLNGSMSQVMFFNQTLTASDMSVLSGGFNNTIKFSIFDAESNNLLTLDNISIDLYNSVANYSKLVVTDTGTTTVAGIPTGSLRIHAYGNLYDSNTVYQSISTNSGYYNISLFMTNSSSDSIKDVLLNVKDETNTNLENAEIRIFILNGTNFNLVTDVFTNINGEALVQLVKDNFFYKFTIHFEGTKCYETTYPFTISGTDDNIFFTCIVEDDYTTRRDAYNNITVDLTFDNTSNSSGIFSMQGSATPQAEFCIQVKEHTRTGQGYITRNYTCENTTAFLINVNVDASGNSRDTIYEGIAWIRPQNESVWQIAKTRFYTFKIKWTPAWDNLGILMTFIIMLLGFFAFIKTPQISVLWVGGTIMVATITRWINIPLLDGGVQVAGGITVMMICIIIAYAITKRANP